MAIYSPLFFPGDRYSSVTSAAVTAGQLLYISGDNTVAPTTAATAAWIGVAEADAASGAAVSVYTEGIHVLGATGAITAGDLVIAATAGTVQTIGSATATTDSQIVGKALAAAASNLVVVALSS
jgi:hypothetical protein